MGPATKYQVLGLLLVGGCVAIFSGDPREDSATLKGLVNEDVTICGNDDIWQDISSPTDAKSIKTINWRKIDGTMKEFIKDHELILDQLESKMQALSEQIEQKKRAAQLRDLTPEEVNQLVEDTVAGAETFNSLDEARATKCGKPGSTYQGKRPNRFGFKNSVTQMEHVAQKWFESNSGAKSKVEIFVKACESHLGFVHTGDPEKDDLSSYCDELCAEMASVVQEVSEARPSPMTDVKRLERELYKTQLEKTTQVASKNDCASAMTRIHTFRDYLNELSEEMSTKHVLFQEAEWALEDAKARLMGLMLALQGAQAEATKAADGLTELGLLEETTKQKQIQADGALQQATTNLGQADEELKGLLADMEAVRTAENFADQVKEKLSLMLLKLDSFAEECVREPVRNIGLSEDTHVYEQNFFKQDLSSLPAREDVEASLTAFHEYCEGTAKPVFDLVKKHIDLSEICKLQEKQATMSEITDAVDKRKKSVVDAIVQVQSWLDPFKGTLVTFDNEKSDYVEQGEPLGLRRVVALMTSGSFYPTYLKKWKKHGEFLTLLAGLGQAIEGLNSKISVASENLEKRTKEAQEKQQVLEEAVAAFQDAAEKAGAEKERLTKVVEDLQRNVDEVKQNLQDLIEKVKEAARVWGESREKLVAFHKMATNSFTEIHAAIY